MYTFWTVYLVLPVIVAISHARNLEELAKHYDVYAVEWMGTGRSDRPKFSSYELEYADAMFVDALEAWRKELKIHKFHLGGHSMGVLGIHRHLERYHWASGFSALFGIFNGLQCVARYAGPLGPALLRFIAFARVSVMPEMSCIHRGLIPKEALAAYWYNNWGLEKSGEIAMHSHLLPGVYAKKPLCVMLTPETIKVPITFMYGGGPDWMTASHGEKLAETFAGKQSVEVVIVPGAGHQVFMDNAPAFNELLLSALARS
ncbi:hypothetical protein JM18_006547 [Phytophthora kernoviae]|uniref:AB hydrolase-1 domain-containing protein n=2 Tax=Phytophthora kernoviae TaxID=325452 RepID=A0A8T0LUD0_9STRA|nr:hypothetical protein G195_007992 [Phytophthora kernoviae 00238/432]KAG2520444.1 hypothetical protein JM16_006706 [Phytophthora kernoviae]KAG2521492.1 hypothetical protein JM18_006547 [Phytophthora kernoviae]